MERSQRLVFAVSQFGASPEDAHSLLDDEFYFAYLVERGFDFLFYAPAYSCGRLEKLFPAHRQRLRVLRASGGGLLACWRLSGMIDVVPGAAVIFFGYSERLVIAFLLRYALMDLRLTLVATNNFSARRVRLYGRQLRAFLTWIRRRLYRLVVHTDHELFLVETLDPTTHALTVSKRHHLMLPGLVLRSARDRPVIAFFGPSKPEKPIEPLAALIAADVGGRFEYRVYGVTEEQGRLLELGGVPHARVTISPGRLSSEDYSQAVAAADIVLLTHNRDFEGKLSGNLCDCIAHQVPFLGSKIEPHLEYLRRFGPIGYVVDMSSEFWAREFLQSFSRADLLLRRQRIAVAAATFTREATYDDLDRCIAGLVCGS